MTTNGFSTPGFWTVMTIAAATCGGLLSLLISHSAEPKHSEAAHEDDVNVIEVRLEKVVADVGHNTSLLSELKYEIGDMRTEQRADTESILSAIRAD
jgi:hypothetical protein